MSAVVSVPETISELTTLLEAGEIREARKLAKTLVNKATDRELYLIKLISDVLENRPRTAVDILRQWYTTAPTDEDRAIIYACVPKNGEQRHRPKPANGRVLPRTPYRAPSAVKSRQDAGVQRARSRQEQAEAADFARYRAESAGVADGDQIQDRDDRRQADQVYASGIDYDRAALYQAGVEFRCLFCNMEREKYDLPAERMQAGHGDDGLCQECRETGKDGIPELPAGHSVTDAVYARCSFIWDRAVTVSAARVFLLGEWKRAVTPAVRAAIADYGRANLPQEQPAETPADLGTCATCPEKRTAKDVRGISDDDGLCAECRATLAEDEAAEFGECGGCPTQRTAEDVRHVAVDDGFCVECRALLAELAAEDEAAELATDEPDAGDDEVTPPAAEPDAEQATTEPEQAERPEYRQHRAPSKRAKQRAKRRRSASLADRKQAAKAAKAAERAAKRP